LENVLIEALDKGVLTLTLNRPDRKNTLSSELSERLLQAVSRAAIDPGVRAVVITGAGGTFCAGGDVKAMASDSGRVESFDARVQKLRQRMEAARLLHQMPKPTIAVIRGAAAGAGLSLALACDLRITTPNAKITTAFAKVGLSGDFGGSYFLTQLVGTAKARELYLCSPVLSGTEAVAMGLVNRVVAEDRIDAEARLLAESLAAGPTVTLGYIKQNLNLAEHAGIDVVFDAEAIHHVRCAATDDHLEAARAFVEKRAPVFQGR
jgi:2-(1,2-epoxy-1,2-dihydrophenyl)acetyl-CoA isomerase